MKLKAKPGNNKSIQNGQVLVSKKAMQGKEGKKKCCWGIFNFYAN